MRKNIVDNCIDYVNIHEKELIEYINKYFEQNKPEMKIKLLNELQTIIEPSLNIFMETTKKQTVIDFLENEYTKIDCISDLKTNHSKQLSDAALYLSNKWFDTALCDYLEKALHVTLTDEEYQEINCETCGFDAIWGECIAIQFNFYEFVLEFMDINKNTKISEIYK